MTRKPIDDLETQDHMDTALAELRVLLTLLDPHEPLPVQERDRFAMMLDRCVKAIAAGIAALEHTAQEKRSVNPLRRSDV